jgi:hypothetical protein
LSENPSTVAVRTEAIATKINAWTAATATGFFERDPRGNDRRTCILGPVAARTPGLKMKKSRPATRIYSIYN